MTIELIFQAVYLEKDTACTVWQQWESNLQCTQVATQGHVPQRAHAELPLRDGELATISAQHFVAVPACSRSVVVRTRQVLDKLLT